MKKSFCFILCCTTLLSLFLSSCNLYGGTPEETEESEVTYSQSDITNYDYELKRIDGKFYMVFEDTRYYMPSGCVGDFFSFDSCAQMKDQFFENKLSLSRLNIIKMLYIQDENGILIPDLENLYVPDFPEGVNYDQSFGNTVTLSPEGYSFHINSDLFVEFYPSFHILNEHSYQKYLSYYSTAGFCEARKYELIKEEAVEERNATVSTVTYNGTIKKAIEYSYKENDKEFFVFEWYSSTDDTAPRFTVLLGTQDGQYIFLKMYSDVRIPEETLKGFGIKPYEEYEEIEDGTTVSPES